MLAFIKLFIFILSFSPITAIQWRELKQKMEEHSSRLLSSPLLIENSPSTVWTLSDYLSTSRGGSVLRGDHSLQSILGQDKQNRVDVDQRHCIQRDSATNQTKRRFIEKLASIFVYERSGNNVLSFWSRHELCSIPQDLADNVITEVKEVPLRSFTVSLRESGDSSSCDYQYLSLKMMGRDRETNRLHRKPPFDRLLKYMLLDPFYDLFGIQYPESLFSMQLWMGSNLSS